MPTQKVLESAIVSNPLIVLPETTVIDAIAQMSRAQITGSALSITATNEVHQPAHSSCVLIVADCQLIGIFTAADVLRLIVQQRLQEGLLIREVMTHPVITLPGVAFTDLSVAINLLQQHRIRHLPLVDSANYPVGLLTYETLLATQNTVLLEAATLEPELQVAARSTARKLEVEWEKLVAEVASKIRSSLSLSTILNTTVEQVRQVLGCERVNIWQFETDSQIAVVAESTDFSISLIGEQVIDNCFQRGKAERYRQGSIRVVSDIYTTEMSDCHRQLLTRLRTRAKILVPLICGRTLWGFLNASESNQRRDWQPAEIELLQTLSLHLSIALQQATTHQRLQKELLARKQVEACLRDREQRYGSLISTAPVGFFWTDAEGECIYANDRWCEIAGLSLEAAEGQGWQAAIHPEDRERVRAEWQQAIQESRPFQLEYRFQRPDGAVIWVYGQVVAEKNDMGAIGGYVGTITDIHARKQAEQQLHNLIAGTAAATGQDFFPVLVQHIAQALNVPYVLVTEKIGGDRLCTLAYWANGELKPTLSLPIANTPCSHVLQDGKFYCASQIQQQFANTLEGIELGAESYLGIALRDSQGEAIGTLCIVDHQPIQEPQRLENLLVAFAARAAAELERERATQTLAQLNRELETKVAERTAALKASEERWQLVLKGANDGIWDWDLTTNRVFFSERWKNMRGLNQEQVSDRLEEWSRSIHPDDYNCVMANLEAHLAGQTEFFEQEYRVRCQDGSYIWVLARGQALRDSSGQVVRMAGSEIDITARKQAEQENLRLKERLQFLLSVNPAVIFTSEPGEDYAITFISDNVQTLMGYTPGDFITHPRFWADRIYPEDAPRIFAGLSRLFEQGYHTHEYRFLYQDGFYHWVRNELRLFCDPAGHPLEIVGYCADISDLKQVEMELAESEAQFRCMVEGVNDLIWSVNDQNRFTYLSPQFATLFGWEGREWIGHFARELIHPDDHPKLADYTQQVMEGRSLDNLEFRHRHQDGHFVWVRSSATPLISSTGNVIGAQGILSDITTLKQAEMALQQSENRFRRVFSSNVVGMMFTDFSGAIFDANDRFLAMVGYSRAELQAGELNWVTLTPLEYVQWDIQAMLHLEKYGSIEPWEKEYYRADGSRIAVLIGVALLSETGSSCVCVVMDISDRKHAEQTIQQQIQKETLLRELTQRIRQSLDLQTIFTTACQEIRQVLQADRVGIFQFYPTSNHNDGEFVAESVVEGLPSVLATPLHDHCFGEQYAPLYVQGRYVAMEDISQLDPCHTDLLNQFQVKANLVIPLISGNDLWGLLCIHQCRSTRRWQATEIDLSQQLATQLAIAFQQAVLYKQTQLELQERQLAETTIAQQLRQQKNLGTIIQHIRESLDLQQILATVTQQVKEALQGDRVIVFQLFPNGKSRIVEEAVSSGLTVLKAGHWEDEVWPQEILDYYWQGQPRIVADVMDDRWTDCLVGYSKQGEIVSKIVAPILQDIHTFEENPWANPSKRHQLWGVLVIHACRQPRVWKAEEAQLLQQIANQLAIAIQQANLFEQLQQELTERQQTQQQLTERNQQLAESNQKLAHATRLKDEFLANMSHELRTPLNAILGMTEGLTDVIFGSINTQQKKALQTIDRSAHHLLELINDILDVAKIESGQIELNCAATSVLLLCQSSLSFIKQQALRKNIHLEVQIPPHVPDVWVDERRIRQVLINLLNNAVKFTPEGGSVTLSVQRQLIVQDPPPLQGITKVRVHRTPIEQQLGIQLQTSQFEVHNYLRIAVTDTGIGIPSHYLHKLFQPFVQIDSALNRQYTGTGLGLALVKRIVELHGGEVGVTSTEGAGSCFTIDLPCVSGSSSSSSPFLAESSPAHLSDPANPPCILLAEDNEANISTISSYLKAKGYRVLVAKNGQEAIDLGQAAQPDLILMDIQMPGVDGLSAIQQLRQAPSSAHLPIIALTALAMNGDRDRCLAAGANEYLSKPVKLSQLVILIQQLLTQS
uniref:histidine kinase n=1 Tax=Cyanothece sp. (strain PCC 7425 / ATCC 29141) TaxID=395961 RepID=B8HNN2_CYAP4